MTTRLVTREGEPKRGQLVNLALPGSISGSIPDDSLLAEPLGEIGGDLKRGLDGGQSQVSPLFKRRVDVRLLSRTEFVQILGSDPHPPSTGRRPRANRQNVSPQARRCSGNQAGFSCSRGIFSFASSSAGPCTSMRTSSARLRAASSMPLTFSRCSSSASALM